jgi:MoxR-like ATPase
MASFNSSVYAAEACINYFTDNAVHESKAQSEKSKNITRVIPLDKQERKDAFAVVPKFKSYFEALNQRMFERGYILELAEVALIAEEHLLLMGPPGNAKSQISDLVLGNIKDDSGNASYFRLQMTLETTMSETHGPMDFKKLNDEGKQERIYDQGALKSKNVFFDEIFDARANSIRNILGLLAERQHAQGPNIVKGDIQTAIGATNRYLSEVYEKAGDDGPKAVIDRFALVTFVPAGFENTSSSVSLITRKKNGLAPIPLVTFKELNQLRKITDQVEIPEAIAKALTLLSYRMKAETEALELSAVKAYKEKLKNGEEPSIPYRATKFHSPRTIGKAANILRAYVVRDWIMSGGKRKLEASMVDLEKLQNFFTLNGPSAEFVNAEMSRTSNPHERAQLMSILQEREIFKRHFDLITEEMDSVAVNYALQDLSSIVFTAKSAGEKQNAVKSIIALMARVEMDRKVNVKQSELDGTDIGKDYVMGYLESLLKGFVTPVEMADLKNTVFKEIAKQKQAVIDERNAEIRRHEEAQLAARKEADRKELEARLAVEKAEKMKRDIEDRFKDTTKLKVGMIDVRDSTTLVASDPKGEVIVVYDKGGDNLQVVKPSELQHGGNVSSIVVSTPLKNEKIEDIHRIYMSDSEHIEFISRSGKIVHRLNLADQNVETIPVSTRVSATTLNKHTDEILNFDHINMKLKKIKSDGSVSTVPVKLALGLDPSLLQTLNRESMLVFEVSENGKYAIIVENFSMLYFQLDLEKNVISLVKKLDSNQNPQELLDNSVARVHGHQVYALDLGGADNAKVLELKVNNMRYEGEGLALIKGTTMLIGGTKDDRKGLKLIDGLTGDVITSDVLGSSAGEYTLNITSLGNGLFTYNFHDGSAWKLKIVRVGK